MGVAYSVAPVSGAHAYVWTLPAGVTISSGDFTNAITVDFAANAVTGNITVAGNNVCGDGVPSPAFAVTVNPYPAPAGTITGQPSLCAGTQNVVFTVAPIANATGYTWTVPPGATIASGDNTNTITVDFDLTASSGNVTVYGTNSCGNGIVSPGYNVTVYAIPPAPVITQSGDTLMSSVATGNQWYIDGSLIPGATGQTYMPTQTGHYTAMVSVNGCNSVPSNEIYFVLSGIKPLHGASISVYPIPNDGQFIIEVSSAREQTFTVFVINKLGVTIFHLNDLIVNGTAKRTIDLRPLPDGIYSIVLMNSAQYMVKEIVIEK
jgi:hypothetical protein